MEVINISFGDSVMCDSCGTDYSHSESTGGMLFQSKAICPVCFPRWNEEIIRHNEERFIRAICPDGMSFAYWVRNFLR